MVLTTRTSLSSSSRDAWMGANMRSMQTESLWASVYTHATGRGAPRLTAPRYLSDRNFGPSVYATTTWVLSAPYYIVEEIAR